MEQKINLSNNQYITYRYFDNNSQKDYEILYLHGFYGDMDGRKGTVLENIAKEHNVNLIKLNYLGHGTSSGKVVDFVLSDWFENIKTVIETYSGMAQANDSIETQMLKILLPELIRNPQAADSLIKLSEKFKE